MESIAHGSDEAGAGVGSGHGGGPANWADLIPRLQHWYPAADPLCWTKIPSHLLAAFIGMVPVLQAERALSMVDALMVTSEYVTAEVREKLVDRLSSLARGRIPDGKGEYGFDINPDRYPGEYLWGGKAVRAWLTLKGGFKTGQIQE